MYIMKIIMKSLEVARDFIDQKSYMIT